MSNEQGINVFFDRVERTREEIEKISRDDFQRILLLCLLDALSKCAFPDETRQGERFVKFIDAYSDWMHKDRVSLIHLKNLLQELETQECVKLKDEVERRLRAWPPMGFGRIPWSNESDPLSKDLDGFKEGRCKKLIEESRYPSLLWKMRNFGVHEMRIVGQSLPSPEDFPEPYYSAYEYISAIENIERGQRSWELNIPTSVISTLVMSCSRQLKNYFERVRMSPFGSFSSALNWHRDAL